MGLYDEIKEEINQALADAATDLKIRKIDDADTYLYIGLALPGSNSSQAAWQIKRMDATGNILFAAGVNTFTQVWDNRASLSYS